MDLTQNKEWVLKAVKGLRTLIENNSTDSKLSLFSKDENGSRAKVNISLSLIKIPKIPKDGKVQPITIRSPIPHSFIDQTTDILLVTKDAHGFRKNAQESAHKFKDLLREHNALGLLTEVMPLQQLQKEYSLIPAKRDLCSQYDLVLCDDTVMRRVPEILGKPFYKAKKRPIQVNLKVSNLRREIEAKLSKSYLHLDFQGSSAKTQIGRLSQSDDALAENICATVQDWKQKLPGGMANVRSLHLKTDFSKAIPLYMSAALPHEVPSVEHPNAKPDCVVAVDSLSTLRRSDRVVEVWRSGAVRILPRDEEQRRNILAREAEATPKKKRTRRRAKKPSSPSELQVQHSKTMSKKTKSKPGKPTTKIASKATSAIQAVDASNRKKRPKNKGTNVAERNLKGSPSKANNAATKVNKKKAQKTSPHSNSKELKKKLIKLNTKALKVKKTKEKKAQSPKNVHNSKPKKADVDQKKIPSERKSTDVADLKGVSPKSKSIKRKSKAKLEKKIIENGVLPTTKKLPKPATLKRNAPKPKKIKQ